MSPVALKVVDLPLLIQTCVATSNQGMSDYGDSSWPLYSMYSKITDGDDNKMVEYCQKDADGTLIFVSPYVSPQMTVRIN